MRQSPLFSVLASCSWIIAARVCDQVCHRSAVCLPAAEPVRALERIKPFLSRFTFLSMQQDLCEHIKHSPCHPSPPPPPPFFCCDPMNYLCQKQNMPSLLDQQRRLARPSRVSSTIKENKKRQSGMTPSSLVIARGFGCDPDGPALCFSV